MKRERTTETDIVSPITRVFIISCRHVQLFRFVLPGTALQNLIRSQIRTCRIRVFDFKGDGKVVIESPFGNVSRHVVKTQSIRSLRGHIVRTVSRILLAKFHRVFGKHGILVYAHHVIRGPERPFVSSGTPCKFPLGFCRQFAAENLAEILSLLPSNSLNRFLGALEHRAVFVARSGIYRFHRFLEELLCHFGCMNCKRGHRNDLSTEAE